MDMQSIASEVNARAKTHDVGQLQELRKELKELKRLPTRDIFTEATIFDEWAFHLGGRKEIQFNIGVDPLDNPGELRYGVAFSLETSRSLPSIDVLVPKVKLFNDFIQLYLDEYADMRMWHYERGKRSSDYTPTLIPPQLATNGVFIFLGKRQPLVRIDYELLLTDLDRLVPLYRYVEGAGNLPPISTFAVDSFRFRPGHRAKATSAAATQAQKELDISLRHNALQDALYHRLAQEHGEGNVRTEHPSGVGTRVDVVVRHKDNEYWFYEIKTLHSPRACIRQALGQLLEYSFWPGSRNATRLIVAGETALDEDGKEYLHTLKQRFSLPIEYEQIAV